MWNAVLYEFLRRTKQTKPALPRYALSSANAGYGAALKVAAIISAQVPEATIMEAVVLSPSNSFPCEG